MSFRSLTTLVMQTGAWALVLALLPHSIRSQTTPLARTYYSVVRESAGELVYRFDFPEPTAIRDANSEVCGWDLPGASAFNDLPFLTYLLELPPGNIDLAILSSSTKDLGPLNGVSTPARAVAEAKYAGRMRQIPLHYLILRPVQAVNGRAILYTTVVLRIRYTPTQVKISENPTEIDGILQNLSVNSGFSRKQRVLGVNATKAGSANPLTGNLRARIQVDSNGIYKLTYDALLAAGLPVETMDPTQLKMTNLGIEIPIYVRSSDPNRFSPGDFIEFYGEKYTADKNPALSGISSVRRHFLDPWTTRNVYFLTWDEPAVIRLVEENGGILLPGKRDSLSSIHFTRSRHFEEDNTRLSLKEVNINQPTGLEDVWFFDGGISNLLTSQSQKSYQFSIEGLSSLSSGQLLTLNLQGISPTSHSIDAKINDIAVSATFSWTGIEKHQVQISIPTIAGNVLHEGANTLTISTPITGNPNQLQLQTLNWFDITYKQKYQAVRNYLEFTTGDQSPTILKQFKIDGFTDADISIYKKGVSRIVNFDLQTDPGNQSTPTYFIDFQDEVQPGAAVEYVAVAEQAKLKPVSIEFQTRSNLRTGFHNARYLIIAPSQFHNEAERLLQHRQSAGLPAEIVDINDIYDEFSNGIKSPYGIRDFLRFTFDAQNWRGSHGPPLYIVLIGDASLNARKSALDIIPTQHIQTMNYGPAAADHWFTLLDDDDLLPDFFVGRIPCSSEGQLASYIDKVLAYETRLLPGEWKNRVVFVGGQSDDRGILQNNPNIPLDVFRFQSTNLINNRLPQSYSPERIFVYPIRDQFYGNYFDVIRSFNDASLLMTYLGHGGGGIWGDLDSITGRPLLNLSQVNELQPSDGRYPVVLSMTCFVGAFDEDGRQSLGESLLLTPNKGALAVLASSGTGWIINDYLMLDQSLQAFLTSGLTIGQALAMGKSNYLFQQGATDIEVSGGGSGLGTSNIPQSMVYQFNFLGDPALKLKVPSSAQLSVSDHSPSSASTSIVTGSAPFPTGSGLAEIFQLRPVVDSILNGANKPSLVSVDTIAFSVSNGSFSFNIDFSTIPNLLSGASGVRVFLESTDGSMFSHASQSFAVNSSYLSETAVIPERPTSVDSIYVEITADDPQGISGVTLQFAHSGSPDILTTPMVSSGAQKYRTGGLGPFPENELFVHRVRVVDGVGDSVFSEWVESRVPAGVDLALTGVLSEGGQSNGISVLAGAGLQLSSIILNKGFLRVPTGKVSFYNGDPRFGGQLLASLTPSFEAAATDASPSVDTVFANAALNPGVHPIYVWIDPDSALPDVDRSNNLGTANVLVNIFNVLPSLGTTLDGVSTDTISADQGLRVFAAPNAVASQAALSIESNSSISIISQPDLVLLTPLGHSAPAAYRLALTDLVSQSTPVRIGLRYDTLTYPAVYADSIFIYRWSVGNKRWMRLRESITKQNGEIWASLKDDIGGTYTLILSRDGQAPIVESTVEGQLFLQGSIAPKRPRISAIVTDRNGVSLARPDFDVRINGEPVKTDELPLPDSVFNANTVTLTLNIEKDFEPGNNMLTIQATDLDGNVSAPDTLKFTVIDQFDIDLIGNFPNPFVNTTVFAYRIQASEPLDDFELTIYTVSGRRVRRIIPSDVANQAINSVGYHEIPWDATNDNGHSVANGIYFYQLKGKLNGKTVRKKGKVAFFR